MSDKFTETDQTWYMDWLHGEMVRRALTMNYPEMREDTIVRVLREIREETQAARTGAYPCDCQHCAPREEDVR